MTPPRRLTNGPRDSQPRWSPDGTQIAFTRAVEKDGKPQPGQIYLLSLGGGEPMQVSAMEKGVGSPQWSPNGSVSCGDERDGDCAGSRRPKKTTTRVRRRIERSRKSIRAM